MESTTDKKYTFRELGSQDLFLMCKIVGKIGVNKFSACFEKESVLKMIQNVDGQDNANTVVGFSILMEIANVVIKNLPNCETEIYQMLANVSDQSIKDLKAMGMVEFFEMIVDFITKEEFKDFFRVVSRFVK